MKLNIKNIFLASALLPALFMGSCTNLDETLYDVISDDNLDLTGEKELSQLLGAAVTNYRYLVTDWAGMWYLYENCSDEFVTPKRVAIGWGDTYIDLQQHDWSVENNWIENTWSFSYVGINYCNRVLDNIEDTEENAVARAHARFYRAMFYYHLISTFGNVPILYPGEHEAGWLPEQEGLETVYNYTVDEFKAIKDSFGEEKLFGYGNRYAACMALAKMYMMKNAWFGTSDSSAWSDALAELNTIIDEGGYSLASDYREPFRENIDGCPEVIFAIPQDRTHTANWTMQSYCFPQTGLEAFGSTAAGYNGSAGIPQFIKSYDLDDLRLKHSWAYGTQYKAVQNSDGTYTPGYLVPEDQREAISFEADDWSGTGKLNYTIELHHVSDPGCYQQEGARFMKYEIPGGGNYGTTATDIAIFRYADVLMMKAECLLRLGQDKQTAADLVSQVRRRAFEKTGAATRTVADLEGPSVYAYGLDNYPIEGYDNWSTHILTNEGGADIELGGLFDDLGWEFAGEMHRRQDMIRFRVGSNNVFNAKSWFCKEGTSETKWNFFPIPKAAMDSNIKLKQTNY